MSWTSRLGSLGRFSPFSRSPPQGPTKVSDADFSYITADDLRRHHAVLGNHPDSPTDFGPPRDTDVLVLRNKKKEYTVHFPAYSIAKGEVTIGQVREHAAKKLGTADLRRVKLLYKGRNLKDDQRLCKQDGLKDGVEVLCAIADSASSSSTEDEDDDISDLDTGEQGSAGDARKRRNRGKKSKRRNRREQQQQASDGNLGVPSDAPRPLSPRPAPSPATPLDKLNAIAQTLNGFEADCEKFRTHPPSEPAKREFEYKRLSESILTMVLLKLDGVETEGDADARMRRKELVRDAQAVLNRLDEANKA